MKRRRVLTSSQISRMQRSKALLLQMRGDARNNKGELQREAPPVSLPKLAIPTLSEIEAKYGAI